MQDAVAIAVALAAALWLGRTLWRQLTRAACGPPPGGPDGFVPLDALDASAKNDRAGPQPRRH